MSEAPTRVDVERAAVGAALHNGQAWAEVSRLLTVDDLTDEDTRRVFKAMSALDERGQPIDPVTVADVLGADSGALKALVNGYTEVPTPRHAAHYAAIVSRESRSRRFVADLRAGADRLEEGTDPDVVAVKVREQIEAITVAEDQDGPAPDLDEFLNAEEPVYDWAVPELIERADRVIVTGGEGHGKSTLIRQVAVKCAAGLHPFTEDTIEPLKVLLIDLENSAGQVRRELRPLRIQAGERYQAGQMRIVARPEGIDLLQPADVAWLERRIVGAEPALVCIGPLYKLATGDPTLEEVARTVSHVFDQLRTRHRFALLIEAHSPYGQGGRQRPERPYGASLWSRWPEFGLHLSPTGALTHWRGARDERAWPPMLLRGGHWPWSPTSRPRDELWGRILDHCQGVLIRPSQRDLVAALDTPKTTIQRTLDEHRDEWNDLFDEDPQ